MTTDCELHHVAYRVPDIERSTREWRQRFQARVELGPTLVSADDVLVSFLVFTGGRIELVQPVSKPVKAGEPGRPDHVCLLCSDFDERVSRAATEQGARIVRPPVASEAFAMRRMCFVFYSDVGLVELVER